MKSCRTVTDDRRLFHALLCEVSWQPGPSISAILGSKFLPVYNSRYDALNDSSGNIGDHSDILELQSSSDDNSLCHIQKCDQLRCKMKDILSCRDEVVSYIYLFLQSRSVCTTSLQLKSTLHGIYKIYTMKQALIKSD